MKYRRFGKTEIQMPVISCGGMRYQESWNSDDAISEENQKNVEACIRRALELGINHIETARGYGTSEEQLGRILPGLPREELIVQTKVPPQDDPELFAAVFERSMSLLKLDYIDLFAFHGLNNEELVEQAMRCFDKTMEWKKQGRVRNIGFSTHGSCSTILKAIETDAFDYVNLHWYYIFQDNWPAVMAARERDMGVFIISPNDKGGLLYKESKKLAALTKPLHPMVFNGLFCLSRPEVHTLSCGVSKPSDFDIHMETVERVEEASELVAPIVEKLEDEMVNVHGEEWVQTWHKGLPDWPDTPGEINMPWILRLRNLALAYDMTEFGKMRYNLLGNGGHWFPGNKADKLSDVDLTECLRNSPHAKAIPAYLAEAHTMLVGEEKRRLQAEA